MTTMMITPTKFFFKVHCQRLESYQAATNSDMFSAEAANFRLKVGDEISNPRSSGSSLSVICQLPISSAICVPPCTACEPRDCSAKHPLALVKRQKIAFLQFRGLNLCQEHLRPLSGLPFKNVSSPNKHSLSF